MPKQITNFVLNFVLLRFRLSRVEKDLAQKKTFVEEMKTKLRKTQDTEERYADTVVRLDK